MTLRSDWLSSLCFQPTRPPTKAIPNVFEIKNKIKSLRTNQPRQGGEDATEGRRGGDGLTVGSRVCSKVSFLWSNSWWWEAVDTRCTANTPRATTSRWPSSGSGRRWDAGIPHTPTDDDSRSLRVGGLGGRERHRRWGGGPVSQERALVKLLNWFNFKGVGPLI